MPGPTWPPSRFWQYWALAGMLVLTAAFWWGVEGFALLESGGTGSDIGDGVLRFSLLAPTPALVIVWLAPGWLRPRVGDGGYWQLLGTVAAIWAGAVLLTKVLAG
jgi:hypothetical protein